MERDEQKINRESTMTSDECDIQATGAKPPEAATPTAFQSFRTVLERVRRGQQPSPKRSELSRDKSKSLSVLVGAGVAMILIFFGLFSSPKSRAPLPGESARGNPSLGRKAAPGQEQNDPARTLTPMLNADVRESSNASGSQVTAQDVGKTSPRYNETVQSAGAVARLQEKASAGKARTDDRYSLKNVEFPDAVLPQTASVPSPPTRIQNSDSDLKKPSIVFVRAAYSATPALQTPPVEGGTAAELIPAGTRLMARLEAPVSSAVSAPVIAVVEYSYERNGDIVLPAGSRIFGKLSHVTSSGFVGLQFDRLEMPDGTSEKIDATAMDLNFGPLRGDVSGRNRGRNFLARSVTGIGTVAAYVIGGQGTTGFNGPISENSLLRERLAENISTAGQDQISMLATNQRIVVTLPGNTRFYIVVEKNNLNPEPKASTRPVDANSLALAENKAPSLEELRELIQLRNELNQMYLQANAQSASPQQ